jgi:hypothetical protein
MKKLVTFLLVFFLFLEFPFQVCHAQVIIPINEGNISFFPNQLPLISITYINGVWSIGKEVTVSSSLKIANRTVLLKDLASALSKTAKTTIINEKNASLAHFGYFITGLSKIEANTFDSLEFRIVTLRKVEPESFINPDSKVNITRYNIPSLNLVISFEDLQKKYNTTVDSFGIRVLNLKGLTSINADPIVYSSNIITVTGYTSGSPCGFNDLWLADKKGTFDLTSRTGISGTDANPVALTYVLRPTDFYVLGSNGNQLGNLSVTVSSWSGLTNCTIRIAGTDRLGVAQTEDFVFTGNAQTYTTKFFHTLTTSQVIGFSGTGSFTYKVTQGQWGVVWKQATNQYGFDAILQIGDGSANTYFKDTSKEIVFSSGTQINTKNKSYVTFGTLVDATSYTTKDGCSFISTLTGSDVAVINGYAGGLLAEIYVYGCSFVSTNGYGGGTRGGIYGYWNGGNKIVVYNSLFTGYKNAVSYVKNGDLYNILATNCESLCAVVLTSTTNYLYSLGNSYGFTFSVAYGGTVKNGVGAKLSTKGIYCWSITIDGYLVNTILSDWTIYWSGGIANTAKIYRQYEFDLKVTFQNETAIQNANVTLKYFGMGGGTVGSWLTVADGKISTKTLTMGYYNQANGNTLQNYNPYNLTITYPNMITYSQNMTLSQKTDWTIALIETPEISEANPMYLYIAVLALIIMAYAYLRSRH